MLVLKYFLSAAVSFQYLITSLAVADQSDDGEEDSAKKKPLRIAVIGSGVSGVSVAAFLPGFVVGYIDVYKSSSQDGREASVELDGRIYEAASNFLLPYNHYMLNFTYYLGLGQRSLNNWKLGLYNGLDEFLFLTSRWDLITTVQMLWTYGLDIINIRTFVGNILGLLENIYELQNSGHAYDSVEELLAAASPELPRLLERSLQDLMLEEGFSKKFIDELVLGAMRDSLGQDVHVPALVGAVGLASVLPGLWEVQGGMVELAKGILRQSGANLLDGTIKEVQYFDQHVVIQHENLIGLVETRIYDVVVIAVPLSQNAPPFRMVGFGELQDVGNVRYKHIEATFVKGFPRPKMFGLQHVDSLPDQILTCDEHLWFNSIGKITSLRDGYLANEVPVWKVYSPSNLSNENLSRLFARVDKLSHMNWSVAYPEYQLKSTTFPKFKLNQHLYYVNAIELAASGIEMSVIGARNVAQLILRDWPNGGVMKKESERTEL